MNFTPTINNYFFAVAIFSFSCTSLCVHPINLPEKPATLLAMAPSKKTLPNLPAKILALEIEMCAMSARKKRTESAADILATFLSFSGGGKFRHYTF